MTRRGEEAIAWALKNARKPPAGLGASDGTWHNMCLQFVRSAFGRPGGTPNAGASYDQAKHKHPVPMTEEGVRSIPRAVPVHFELPTVADHIALGLGKGKCLSTDAVHTGQADIVDILGLAHAWGATAIRWAGDLNGDQVYSPPKPPAKTPNITAALGAESREDRVRALKQVVEHSSGEAAQAARSFLKAIDDLASAEADIATAREALKKHEVR